MDAVLQAVLKTLTPEQADTVARMQAGYEERLSRQAEIINRLKEKVQRLQEELG